MISLPIYADSLDNLIPMDGGFFIPDDAMVLLANYIQELEHDRILKNILEEENKVLKEAKREEGASLKLVITSQENIIDRQDKLIASQEKVIKFQDDKIKTLEVAIKKSETWNKVRTGAEVAAVIFLVSKIL
ncbi:MAG TPA: hypothetical protein VFD00_00655 [Thermoclostridium sp.]|nr:hypothetical protein [Thermoclostridium sp.]